jgi:hypothetical protein
LQEKSSVQKLALAGGIGNESVYQPLCSSFGGALSCLGGALFSGLGALGFELALGALPSSESKPSLAQWAWPVSGGATWGKFDSRKFRPEINPEPDVRPENASSHLNTGSWSMLPDQKLLEGIRLGFTQSRDLLTN